jgi:hypothetical protein
MAGAEAGERAFALRLRFVAVNGGGFDAGADEMPRDPVRTMLCSGEDEHPREGANRLTRRGVFSGPKPAREGDDRGSFPTGQAMTDPSTAPDALSPGAVRMCRPRERKRQEAVTINFLVGADAMVA